MSANLLDASTWEVGRTSPGGTAPEVWIAAEVPGTAALAWSLAFGAAAGHDLDVDGSEWWWRTEVVVPRASTYRLSCDGIATAGQIIVDGVPVSDFATMWRPVALDLDLENGRHTIEIRCLSMTSLLAVKRPRPRWRSTFIPESGLRWWRTSLLGRMPALAPQWAPAGPWRPVTLTPANDAPPRLLDLQVSVEADDTGLLHGVVQVVVEVGERGRGAFIEVAGTPSIDSFDDGIITARVEIDDPPLWWPHGYGAPALVDLDLVIGEERMCLRRIGFRNLSVDRSEGGFQVSVNHVPIFARGAVWTPTDPVGLRAQPAELRRQLGLLIASGATMVRVVGTSIYESDEFLDLCDELGLLLWQDAMLATLDPPSETEWLAEVELELRHQLGRLQGRPCAAVVSGGTETEQQPVFLGLPASHRTMPVIEEVLPRVAAELLPASTSITSSPSGGDLPTVNSAGVAHYFGVGGYRRSLGEVRGEGVRFAAECLAFAVPPSRPSYDRLDPSWTTSTAWDRGVPRDRGADWTFLDVTDHYVRTLWGADPLTLSPEVALDLRSMVCAWLIEAVFSEWRRPASTCAGALVLEWRDRVPGPGWGMLDFDGLPKSTWYAARRVWAPRAITISDEGLDGLAVHVHNDVPDLIDGHLEVALLSVTGGRETVTVPVAVEPHGTWSGNVEALIGGFRDVTNAHGFGAPQYVALITTLVAPDGDVLASNTRALPSPAAAFDDPRLSVTVERDSDGWCATVTAERLAPCVIVDAPEHISEDSWFPLAPGASRTLRLAPRDTAAVDARPHVSVRSAGASPSLY